MSLDTKIAQYHRLKAPTAAPGAPLTTGLSASDVGMLAINFAGHDAAEKAAGKVAIYSYGGTTWEHLNATTAVSTQTIPIPGVAGIGVGYTGLTAPQKKFTGDIVIGTYGLPAGAFLLTDSTNPGADASWTSLGGGVAVAAGTDASIGTDNSRAITSQSLRAEILRLLGGTADKASSITSAAGGAVGEANKILLLNADGMVPLTALPIATQPEMEAGSATDKLNTPEGLRAELVRALGIATGILSTGNAGIATGGGVAGAAGKIPLLDGGGHIDASFLGIQGLNFIGTADMAAAIPAAPTAGFQNGDVYTHAGAVAAPFAAWGFNTVVTSVEPGDMALYDGTKWHHTATAADLSNVVLKAGGNAMAADAVLTWTDPGTVDTVIIDGAVAANAVVQNITLKTGVINGGTF